MTVDEIADVIQHYEKVNRESLENIRKRTQSELDIIRDRNAKLKSVKSGLSNSAIAIIVSFFVLLILLDCSLLRGCSCRLPKLSPITKAKTVPSHLVDSQSMTLDFERSVELDDIINQNLFVLAKSINAKKNQTSA